MRIGVKVDGGDQSRQCIGEIAHGICSLPNPILVGGHTDRTTFPAGSTYTNWELSADRANAARRELESNCVKPEQIRRIVGYADTEPLIPDDPYAVGNRRISITVLRLAGGEGVAIGDKNDGKEQILDPKNAKPDLSKPVYAPPVSAEPPSNHGEVPVPDIKLGDKKSVSVGTPDEIPANVKVRKENH